ncbi:MAG: hypothetical protein AMJ55_04735 [Gammaproteobacteria bacterium SG8_15]|nr:MAG: hypothetical protein AMJ55_04735 [Gammaproteobacteria bacterium SG8_15]
MILEKLRSLRSDHIWHQIYGFAQQYPNTYAALQVLAALVGYVYLLLFPVLLLAGIWTLGSYVVLEQASGNAMHFIGWTLITGISAMVTIQLTKIKFFSTPGITLDAPMANKLHLLLDKFADETTIPRIDRIVVTEQLSIDLVKTPTMAIPFWSSNTLVIGLPLMQCLTPEYFECAVIRKLLQYTKRRNCLIKWLHQLRNVWLLYMNVLSKNITLGTLPLAIFFKLYAPLYRDLTTPVAHRNELDADLDTLQFVNDEDLLQTIEAVIVAKIYLDQQYWPKIRKSLKENQDIDIQPYSKLEEMLKQGLTTKNTKRWLDSVFESESHRLKAIPSLRARMHNIGRARIRIPERLQQTAAQAYLEHDYLKIVDSVNQLWKQRHSRIPGHPVSATHSLIAAQQSGVATQFSSKAYQ